jgi:hypothetical protein
MSQNPYQISKQLYKTQANLFYVYTPRWINSSAGVKVLHYLCHALNCAGQDAYLILSDFPTRTEPRINANLKTPILTKEEALAHIRAKRFAITIYPETVPGNPLGAPRVVRYLLNYAGALGGEKVFPDSDFLLAFSENIASNYEKTSHVKITTTLFLPPVDPREFQFNRAKGNFQVVYAGKYRTFVGPPPKVGNLPSIEILRDGPEMQTRDEVKKLLSAARVMYTFENTSLITEAILSGTPVLGVKNDFFTELIAEHATGTGGFEFLQSNTSFNEAEKSVHQGSADYKKTVEDFNEKLHLFVERSVNFFETNNNPKLIRLRTDRILFINHKLILSYQIIRSRGFGAFIRMAYYYLRRRIGLALLRRNV